MTTAITLAVIGFWIITLKLAYELGVVVETERGAKTRCLMESHHGGPC